MSEIGDIASILMLNGGGSLPRKGDNPVLEALIDGALKKSQEPGFFSREAGQKRRAWLDETVNYFTPPELRGPLGLLNEANPVTSMERVSTASQTMLAPETSGWGRVAAGGDMLSNMAGIVAPAMVAGKAGMPAVNAIEEGLLGWAPGMPAAAGNFVADEFGGMKLYRGETGSSEKITGGIGEGYLFGTPHEDVARLYGDNISQFELADDAKILTEGSREFAKITGRKSGPLMRSLKPGENLKDVANLAVERAKAAGYDAVEFNSLRDMGTAVLNPNAVKKGQQ